MRRNAGLIQPPPRMLGEMGKWMVGIFSLRVLSAFEMALKIGGSPTPEALSVLKKWGTRAKGKSKGLVHKVFPLDLRGWKYLNKVKDPEDNFPEIIRPLVTCNSQPVTEPFILIPPS